ncbi:MAG: pilus assembly protein TadG-related protein [Chloroflexota bacterium]
MNIVGRRSRTTRGQALIIVALGMVVLVGAVGLVIDGGHLWGRQRDTQNGDDSAAEAGAVQLVKILRGNISVADGAAAVCSAVEAQAAANEVDVDLAYYTDLAGNRLGVAIDADGTCQPIPACTPPTCAGDFASGVEVLASVVADTFLMGIMGFDQVTISTTATAIGGYVLEPCQSEDVEGCLILPITPPVTVVVCDNTNRPVTQDTDGDTVPDLYEAPSGLVTLPFCRTAAGSIGWLDWDPDDGGGANEIEEEILNPTWEWPGPDWYQVTQTGDINSSRIEAAINTYTNLPIYLPMFDGVCSFDPGVDLCPPDDNPGGSNVWYHLPQLAAFQLLDPRNPEGDPPRSAWITGNDAEIKAVCGEVTESGATSCLTGQFVELITDGPVGALPDGQQTSTFYGVQLIR